MAQKEIQKRNSVTKNPLKLIQTSGIVQLSAFVRIQDWLSAHSRPRHSLLLLCVIEKNEMGGACSAYGGEEYSRFWWENLRERDRLRDPGVDGMKILRWIFGKWDVGVWTGSRWLRTGTDDRYL